MRVRQVNKEFVKAHLDDVTIFRVMLCDDSHSKDGKPYYSMRVRQLSTLQISELEDSLTDKLSAFIKVELDD